MKPEYNFSQAERGKFYRKDAVLDLPVYLDADIRDWLTERAKAKGIDLGRLVNDLLKRDIELIEAVKKNARRKAGRWEALGASKTDCPVFFSVLCFFHRTCQGQRHRPWPTGQRSAQARYRVDRGR